MSVPAAPAVSWTYVNHWRMLAGFLGFAMLLLGAGVILVTGSGSEAAFGAAVLLGVAVFITVFAVLLFFPRLRRQGGASYRTIVPGTMEDVEQAVRDALQVSGRAVRVEQLPSRAEKPPRLVIAEGISARFLLEPVSLRESGDGRERTELAQLDLDSLPAETARELRDLVGARLPVESESAR